MRISALLICSAGLFSVSGGCSSPTKSVQPGNQPVDKSCSPRACQADLAAGRAALDRGDFAAASAAYACGDTREASFGAGLTTLIAAIESPSASKVLADVGLPPLSARDLLGSTGLFNRYASRWHGNGMIQMSDGLGHVQPLTFERGQQLVGNGTYVRMRSTSALTSMSLQFGTMPPAVGATIQFGCQSTGFVPYGSLTTEDAYCSTPLTCSSDAGSVTLVAGGTKAGDHDEYALHAVKFECGPKSGTGARTNYFVDGTLTTILGDQVDVSDLHPLLSDDEPFSAVPPTTTLGQVVADAQGVRDSLDIASCYFKVAAAGSAGQVFEVPASLFGGSAIPITAADAKLLAAASETTAGALQLLAAYELPMVLTGMLCGGSIECLSNQQATDRFNGGIGRLVSSDAAILARNRFLDASDLGAQAFAELDSNSVILRTADTAAALDRAHDYLQWAHDSLSGQNPAIPHVTPSLAIDLAAPLANPPDPSTIPYKPLSYDPATNKVTVVDAFMRAAFPAWNHLQWTQAFWDQFDVASLPAPDRSGLIDRRLEAYGLTGN
jgi:hypothetical protein